MKIIKRNGKLEEFIPEKISDAILKAMKFGSGNVDEIIAKSIANNALHTFVVKESPTVEQIEEFVYNELIRYNHKETARHYEGYRAVQAYKRQINTTDDAVLSLLNGTDEDMIKENSNKNAKIIPTQRDLMAGEISKDIVRRKILPAHIVQAHDNGVIHFHDMDYFIQPMFNCCLVNITDMLDNGTVINGKMVESPKSFQVACTVMTQIIAQIASGQYGGQSIDVKALGKYLAKSKLKYQDMCKDILDFRDRKNMINTLLKKELEAGVQTIQYQINTLMTTNGQSPFVTLFLNIDENDEYAKEVSMIVEEILKQRIEGIKNEKGVYVTPSFPKLVYVLHQHNCFEGGDYDCITELAAQCTVKRIYPDYISSKEMKKIYDGNIFSPMGQQ